MVVADKVSFTSSALTLEAALSTINSLSESVSSMITISEDSGGNTDPETGELIDMEDGFFRISSGICVQWGILRGAQDTITFQVPFVGNKYSFFINPINATYSYKELDKQGSYIKINRGSGSPDCYWMAMGLAADYNFDEPEIPEEGELELE